MTFEQYLNGVRGKLRMGSSLNEGSFYEWCFQKWCGRPAEGYKESAFIRHAKDYERCVADGFGRPGSDGRTDRSRRISSRNG